MCNGEREIKIYIYIYRKRDINEILNRGVAERPSTSASDFAKATSDKKAMADLRQAESEKLKVKSGQQEQKKPVVVEPKVPLPVVPIRKVESGKLKVESADRSNWNDRTNLTDVTNTTQDLNQIRLDIEKKKQMAQAAIDKRLESLRNRSKN